MSRVISGAAKGLKLEVFPNLNMRPTTNRVKEALFDIIQFDIVGSTFLDLFSGTGQIAIEALSRGASHVFAVENSFESLKIMRKNINNLKRRFDRDLNLDIINFSSFKFLDNFNKKIDIVFVDAPFDLEISRDIFLKFEKIANNLIITETLHKNEPVIGGDLFHLLKRYKYGKVSLNVYTRS